MDILIIIYIRAASAEAGPPLGTILGNLGINTVKFCKEFNDHTKDLSNYLKLKVKIVVKSNKTYSFEINLPSTGNLLSLLKGEKSWVYINELCMLSKLKFPYLSLDKSLPIILGSLGSLQAKAAYRRNKNV